MLCLFPSQIGFSIFMDYLTKPRLFWLYDNWHASLYYARSLLQFNSNLLCMLHFYFYLHFLLHAPCSLFTFTYTFCFMLHSPCSLFTFIYASCSIVSFYFYLIHASFFVHDNFVYIIFTCMVTLHASLLVHDYFCMLHYS